MGTQTYLVALGSNVRGRWGTPRQFLAALSLSAIEADGTVRVLARSRLHDSAPLGHGTRSYANAVVVVESDLRPAALLVHLKAIERAHGRRAGRRWGDRILDLDIVGWSGGRWFSRRLQIPHPQFRRRRFVLEPLVEIAPTWRDPVTHLTARHLHARLVHRRPKYSQRP